MKIITVQPSDVWEHYKKSEQMFVDDEAIETLATNPTTGVIISLQVWNDIPSVFVEMDDEEIYSEYIFGEEDAVKIQMIYDKYLSDNVVHELDWDGFYNDEAEDEIEAREEELDNAILCMLDDFSPNIELEIEDRYGCLEDLKNIIGGYLAQEHGISIYRPMIMSQGGYKRVVEYPYGKVE